jgi:hypothetical protein
MNLSCQKAFVLVLTLTMACNESTAPPPEAAPRLYILESINGRPIPTFVSADQTGTSFVLWATLTLDVAGNAVREERWRNVYPPNTEEGTFIAHYQYRIIGDNITVGIFTPCPIDAVCEGNKVGKITGTSLTLAYENPTAPIFLYRLASTD